MAKPPLNGVAETEYTKSQQGGLTPSFFRTTGGVHELVARAMRGKCVRQRGKGKIGSFAAPRNLILPRVRTKCARKPSRFVHASLHARWIMGGAGVNPVHALTKARIFASLLQWEKVARFTAADEVLPCVYCQKTYFTMFAPRHAPNSNRRKKQSGDCSPLCFWKEKLLFSTSKNDSLILGIRVEFLECYTDLNLCAILLINCCRGYAAA
mgnify:FL=1